MASQYGGYGYQTADTHTNLLPQQSPPQQQSPPPQQLQKESKDPQPPTYPHHQQQQSEPYGSYSSSLQQPQPQSDQQEQQEQLPKSNCDPSQWSLSRLVFINIINMTFLCAWSGLLIAYNTSSWHSSFFTRLMSGITAGISIAYAAFLLFWLVTACCKCWDPRQIHWIMLKLYVLLTLVPATYTFIHSFFDYRDHSHYWSGFILYNILISMYYIFIVQRKKDITSSLETSQQHVGVQCFLVQYLAPLIFVLMLCWGLCGSFITTPPPQPTQSTQGNPGQYQPTQGYQPSPTQGYQPSQYQQTQGYQQIQ